MPSGPLGPSSPVSVPTPRDMTGVRGRLLGTKVKEDFPTDTGGPRDGDSLRLEKGFERRSHWVGKEGVPVPFFASEPKGIKSVNLLTQSPNRQEIGET